MDTFFKNVIGFDPKSK